MVRRNVPFPATTVCGCEITTVSGAFSVTTVSETLIASMDASIPSPRFARGETDNFKTAGRGSLVTKSADLSGRPLFDRERLVLSNKISLENAHDLFRIGYRMTDLLRVAAVSLED